MRSFFVVLVVLLAVLVSATPTAEKTSKPFLVHAKQQRRTASELAAYHEQRRRTHKNYIPSYPADPITIPITIGTPAVAYAVSLESGSEAIFVLDKNYPGRAADQRFYDPAQSSTSKYAGKYTGYSGHLVAYGHAYDDVVGLLGMNTTQRFGVVNDVHDEVLNNPPMPDGVFGMSWDPEDAANPNENSSAIINLFADAGLSDRYFCQRLENYTDDAGKHCYTFMLSFGECLDDYHCEQPTPPNTYPLVWLEDTRSLAFFVDVFTYSGRDYNSMYAKVDSGVPNVLFPIGPLIYIIDDVEPDYSFALDVYLVDCGRANSLPDWEFTIDGNTYAIPATSYVVDLDLGNNLCALSAGSSDAWTTDFVLGYVFHDMWCIKMDIENQAISILKRLAPSTIHAAINEDEEQ